MFFHMFHVEHRHFYTETEWNSKFILELIKSEVHDDRVQIIQQMFHVEQREYK